MSDRPALLIVDDEPGIVESLTVAFEEDYEVIGTTDPEEAMGVLGEREISVIIADQRMPGISGVDLLKEAKAVQPDAVRLILSAYTDMEDLIAAINAGEVWRYLVKPWEPNELRITVDQAAEKYGLVKENQRLLRELKEANARLQADCESLRDEVEKKYGFEEIVGGSDSMEKLFHVLRRIADSPVTILLQGETGTGKELIAKAIHYNSSRKRNKLLVQNCGALPDGLLESELFGHRKGSFTGAVEDKKGLFEEAHGGTVFLDEISETSPAMQVRLLRVLQEGEVKRVGESDNRQVDVRIIAATNKDLEQQVKEGNFREDLYYRLAIVPVDIPPLRDRKGDVSLLARYFMERARKKFGREVTRISDQALRLLEAYSFPGNVRELENEIERAVMMAEGEEISERELSDKILRNPVVDSEVANTGELMSAVDNLKRKMIGDALDEAGGNKTKAAQNLGLTRQSLQQMMKRLGME